MDIKIRIVPNPLYGTEGSLVENPYKGEVIHTGTVTAADICEACKKDNPQMTEPLASLATETIMDYGSERVVEDVVRFNLGSAHFTMEPAVSGSVPTVDAALTDANERYIKVVNGTSLNARIAALKPVIVGEGLGDVQFHSTETTHDGENWKNTVFGDEEFVALGKRLGGPDQKLELQALDGTVLSEATFLGGDELGQRFRYKLATPPAESLTGKLVLSSTGKDTPELNPKSISVQATYVKAEPPKRHVTIRSIRGSESECFVHLEGSDYDGLTGYEENEEEETFSFDCELYVNGTRVESARFRGDTYDPDYADYVNESLRAGDEIRVVLTPDPAKADEFDQTPITLTCTVE